MRKFFVSQSEIQTFTKMGGHGFVNDGSRNSDDAKPYTVLFNNGIGFKINKTLQKVSLSDSFCRVLYMNHPSRCSMGPITGYPVANKNKPYLIYFKPEVDQNPVPWFFVQTFPNFFID